MPLRKKTKFIIKTKTIRTPKGFRLTDIDRFKEGVTVFFAKKRGKKKRRGKK